MSGSGSRSYSATIAAGGTGTATIVTGSRRRRWIVEQVSVELATAPIGATCSLRLNGVQVTPMVPTGDAAGGDPPVTLEGTDVLTVVWAGCTPGTVGSVLIIYTEEAR